MNAPADSSVPTAPLTETHLENLVRVFYERARANPELAKVFEPAIADWDHHHRIVQDFWSHALLKTERYTRHAYPAHMNIGIRPEHFPLWLTAFREAANETLPPEAAREAIARAEFMAGSFHAGLFPFEPPAKFGST